MYASQPPLLQHSNEPPSPTTLSVGEETQTETDDQDVTDTESDEEEEEDIEVQEALQEADRITSESTAAKIKEKLLKRFRYVFIYLLLGIGSVCGLIAITEIACTEINGQCILEQVTDSSGKTQQLTFRMLAWWAGISLAFCWAATALVLVAFTIFRALPITGKSISYFLQGTDGAVAFLLTTIGMVSDSRLSITFGDYLSRTNTTNSTFNLIFPNLLWGFLVTGVVFTAKGLLIRILAITFHRAAYVRRIRKALLSEYILNAFTERDPTLNKVKSKTRSGLAFDTLPLTENELVNEDKISNFKLAGYIEYLQKSDLLLKLPTEQRTVVQGRTRRNALAMDAAPVKSLGLSRKVTMFRKRVHNMKAGRSEDDKTDLDARKDTVGAEVFAKSLYVNLHRNSTKPNLHPEDFLHHLPDQIAELAFSIFDLDVDGVITEREFYRALLLILRERAALRASIADAERSVTKLHGALTGIAIVMLIVIYIMIYQHSVSTVLVSVSSVVVAGTFAFGNSVKTLFESILFLFATHPFDIGDNVIIEETVYTVVKFDLLSSVLRTAEKSTVYMSNAELAAKEITNLRRSPDMIDWLILEVDAFTPQRSLRELQTRLSHWLGKRSMHFYPTFEMEIQDVKLMNKMSVRFWIQHRGNFQNRKKMRMRRQTVYLKLLRICEQLKIGYVLPSQEVVYDDGPTSWAIGATGRNPDDLFPEEKTLRKGKTTKKGNEDDERKVIAARTIVS